MKEKKINLLIVDDEELFLDALKRRLEVRDFNVITVDRGDKALDAAREYPIDAAIVDLRMPGMSGEETRENADRMSDEEAYYWYAKCTNSRNAQQSTKALRILLAGE